MALVLAIETDPDQAEILRQVQHAFAHHEVIFATSIAEALDFIDQRLPDLILVDPLLSPGDETALVTRLRQLPGTANLRMLTIPLLASVSAKGPVTEQRWFYWFKRPAASLAPAHDTLTLETQIGPYLQRTPETSNTQSTTDSAIRDAPETEMAGPAHPGTAAGCWPNEVSCQTSTLSAIGTAAIAQLRHSLVATRSKVRAMQARAIELALQTLRIVHTIVAGLTPTLARLQVRIKRTVQRRVERSAPLAGGSKSAVLAQVRPRDSQSPSRLRPLATALVLLATCVVLAWGFTVSSGWPTVARASAIPHGSVIEHTARHRPKPTGSLRLTSIPHSAVVIVDSQKRGVTPLTIDDLEVGTHEVTFESGDYSVHRTINVRANRAATLETSLYPGWLALFAPIELEISEHGRRLHLDDDNRTMLPAGRHELQLVNRSLGYHDTKVVEVAPLAVTAASIDLPKSLITIDATPSAEVLIDGARAGETPLIDLPVDIGTREILLKNPAFGERRRMVTVTVKKMRININLAESEP